MKRLIGLAMAVLVMCGSTLAAGGIFITIDSSKQGQIKTGAKVFQYPQSPRDLANAPPESRAVAARAGARRSSQPVVIVRDSDSASQFFVKAAAQGELLPAVLFEFKRTGSNGQPEVYQTVRLVNAMVSSVKTISGNRPGEEVSFTFQKIEYQHKDGKAAAADNWSQ